MTKAQKQTYEEPLYNIGVATRLTGLPIATLHAWERRYGFPASGRTAGGHRLYSEKDIERLRWVKAQVEAGMQTRQAIQAVQRLESQGRLPINLASKPAPIQAEQLTPPVGREHLLDALLKHQLESADRIMAEMLAFISPEVLTLDVIGPALVDIGDAWAAGRCTVADEHLATSYLRHRLLMWMVTGPQLHAVHPVVLACAPDEWHEGSLLMLGVLLRRQGWPVAYLGQAVPLADLATFCQAVEPVAVVLAATGVKAAHNLSNWPKILAQTAGRPLVGYGGQAFIDDPKLQEAVPGIYLGPTLQLGLTSLNSYLQTLLK